MKSDPQTIPSSTTVLHAAQGIKPLCAQDLPMEVPYPPPWHLHGKPRPHGSELTRIPAYPACHLVGLAPLLEGRRPGKEPGLGHSIPAARAKLLTRSLTTDDSDLSKHPPSSYTLHLHQWSPFSVPEAKKLMLSPKCSLAYDTEPGRK